MINKVTLIGNLGGDPEVKTLENGSKVARFSLATSTSYKDKEGNWQKNTQWHTVVSWRDLAERVEKSLKKGMQVYVEGEVTYRKHTDKEGIERLYTDIVAATVRLLEKKESSDGQCDPAPAKLVQQAQTMPPAVFAPPDNTDDLPF